MNRNTTIIALFITLFIIGIFGVTANAQAIPIPNGGGSGGGSTSSISPVGNLSISSGAYLPDKGISWDTYFRNGEGYASAHLSTEVFNNGESEQYFVLDGANFNVYQDYSPDDDPGLRRFTAQMTYNIVNEAPTPEEFEYTLVDQEYDSDGCRISMRGTARNGYDYIWSEEDEDGNYQDPIRLINANIETSTSIYIDSSSAEFYGISCDAEEQYYSWQDHKVLEVYMTGTFHTPEPATLGLLAAGGLALLRRKRR